LAARCRANAQDVAAFQTLYERHAERIFRRFVSLFGRHADAEDATQATFYEAFRSLGRFDGRGSFGAWLGGIATHVGWNTMRAAGRRRRAMEAYNHEGDLRHTAPGVERKLDAREGMALLERHLAELDPKKRTAFVLYYVEQASLEEVAEALACSRDNAWAHIRRARAAILLAIAREQKRAKLKQVKT